MNTVARVDVEMAAVSHAGKVRSNNEDHYLAVCFERTARTLLTNLSEVPGEYVEKGYGLVVADGVGGSNAGEIASSTAVRVILQLALETPDWIMTFDAKRAPEVLERMEVRFRKVKDAFVRRAEAEPALAGMGTTMTLACTAGINLIIAHIGDSRAYLFRRGELHQLTRDQTVAQNLADAGAIRPEEVATHPRRHILTGAITTRRSESSAELHHLELADGDQLLLCTDGLTDMTSDAAIAGALGRPGPPEAACQALVDLALQGGGKDNVTVVLARYRIAATR
jgi:protein phosphatase